MAMQRHPLHFTDVKYSSVRAPALSRAQISALRAGKIDEIGETLRTFCRAFHAIVREFDAACAHDSIMRRAGDSGELCMAALGVSLQIN